jgi:hypothetical protein
MRYLLSWPSPFANVHRAGVLIIQGRVKLVSPSAHCPVAVRTLWPEVQTACRQCSEAQDVSWLTEVKDTEPDGRGSSSGMTCSLTLMTIPTVLFSQAPHQFKLAPSSAATSLADKKEWIFTSISQLA